jgi:hypothetical protein
LTAAKCTDAAIDRFDAAIATVRSDDAAPNLPQDEKRRRSRGHRSSYRSMARIVQPEQQRHDSPQRPLISNCNRQ